MPLNDSDRAWIRQEIRKRHPGITGFIKDWGGLGAAVAILVFMLAEWSSYIEFRTHTSDRLEAIEKKLTASELQSQASVPQAVFEKTLPDLRSAVTNARKKDVRVSPAVIEDLRSKLLATSPSAPEFWPTVSEFVSYRSSVTSEPPEQARKLLTERIPNCTDSLPKPMMMMVVGPKEVVQTRGVYENCRFVLDSPSQDQTLNAILKGNTPLITFKNCLIEYGGGQINLILAWDKETFTGTMTGTSRGPSTGTGLEDNIKTQTTKSFEDNVKTGTNKSGQATISMPESPTLTLSGGPTIQFENCLFVLTFQNTPPPNGQRLSTALLTQNATSVSFPLLP